jgi:hypothetical protein
MTLTEKAKDLKSSGYTLVLVGGIGLIAMILVLTGVISLEVSGAFGIVTKIVMTFLFALFFVLGVRALIKSKTVAQDAIRETGKRAEIKKWFTETYDAASVDSELEGEIEESDIYFERTDIIRKKISERFMDVEESLMSQLIEELYTEYFE